MLNRVFYCLPAVAFFVGLIVAVTNANAINPLDQVIIRSYQHSELTVAGILLNGSGNPAAGVGVSVVAYPLAGGAASGFLGASDSTGHYRIYVPRGASRLLVVSAGGETTKVKELVRPGLWLTVRSRRHGLIVFTGGVLANGLFPTILLQDRTPVGWQTFGAVNPNAYNHRWRYYYHAIRQVAGFRFSFRVTTLPNPAWIPGYSTVKTARVR